MTSYPSWLFALVTAVQYHEDVHAATDHCLEKALNDVPHVVRAQAEAIAQYQKEQHHGRG